MTSIEELKKDPKFGSQILLIEFLDDDEARSEDFIEGARTLFLMVLGGQHKVHLEISEEPTSRDAFMYGFFEAIKFYGNYTFGKSHLEIVP